MRPSCLGVSLRVPVAALQFSQRLRVLLGIVTRLGPQRIACFQTDGEWVPQAIRTYRGSIIQITIQ